MIDWSVLLPWHRVKGGEQPVPDSTCLWNRKDVKPEIVCIATGCNQLIKYINQISCPSASEWADERWNCRCCRGRLNCVSNSQRSWTDAGYATGEFQSFLVRVTGCWRLKNALAVKTAAVTVKNWFSILLIPYRWNDCVHILPRRLLIIISFQQEIVRCRSVAGESPDCRTMLLGSARYEISSRTRNLRLFRGTEETSI